MVNGCTIDCHGCGDIIKIYVSLYIGTQIQKEDQVERGDEMVMVAVKMMVMTVRN